ncbi:MAG: GIY-YIG nuclease family protein, partial [Prolixibacteraceae bacterium]|nr:GIY-YIG nuclease family protein [Prolixibacteraceae bacterium]
LYSFKIDRYYIGYTNNIERRIAEHNRKKGKYTDRGIPWEIVYTEQYKMKQDAEKREKEIKAEKSRNYIEELIRHFQ